MPGFEIITLKSGIKTLRDLDSQEIFHPGIGPMEEARILHVDQQRIKERASKPGKLIIWDVGLGAAANAIAALDALIGCESDVELHSFDIVKAPTEFALTHAADLDYVQSYATQLSDLLNKGEVKISDRIKWFYHLGQFKELMYEAPPADAVFYDPYSSKSNQELWTLDHLKRFRTRLNEKATITNYSASSAVRVTWLLADFYVGAGIGVGKKVETHFTSPTSGIVPNPLGREWLEKMQRSQSSAPIREAKHTQAVIGTEDFAKLSTHPQFH